MNLKPICKYLSIFYTIKSSLKNIIKEKAHLKLSSTVKQVSRIHRSYIRYLKEDENKRRPLTLEGKKSQYYKDSCPEQDLLWNLINQV